MNKKITILALLAICTMALAQPVRSIIGIDRTESANNDFPKNPTAADYIQDGLVAMWDGIENVGYGLHEDNPSAWISLVNPVDRFNFPPPAHGSYPRIYAFSDECLHADSIPLWQASTPASYSNNIGTLECAIKFKGFLDSYSPQRVPIVTAYSVAGQPSIYLNKGTVNGESRIGLSKSYYGRKSVVDFTLYIGKVTSITVFAGELQFGPYYDNYVNGTLGTLTEFDSNIPGWNYGYRGKSSLIGNWASGIDSNGWCVNTDIYCIRLYNRRLTPSEIHYNYLIDKERFNLP